MNGIRWYVDTDTFREFHYVDNTGLHAVQNIAKANWAVTQALRHNMVQVLKTLDEFAIWSIAT